MSACSAAEAPPAAGAADRPLTPAEFAGLMVPFAPFEPAPLLAVAVSGGPDSLAACLLSEGWARERGGRVAALIVDHRLRPESAAEAAQVAGWLAGRGIEAEILVWHHPPMAAGVQAAAREARHALLAEAAARHGALHLVLGHSRDDQAETVLLRLGRGSGAEGLAGMAAVQERAELRLLRPLLGVAKTRLRATCRAFGQPWIEDPGNAAEAYARGRLRRVLPLLAGEGLDPAGLAETARRAGQARAALDAALAARLAETVAAFPEGFVLARAAALVAPPDEIALRALARCLMVVGAAAYPPRRRRLEGLLAAVRAGALAGGRTLGGCLVVPRAGAGQGVLAILREPDAATERLPLGPGQTVWWDRRFRLRQPPGLEADAGEIRRLGRAAAGEIRRLGQAAAALRGPWPRAALAALPGLWQGDRLVAGPMTSDQPFLPDMPGLPVRFAPAHVLAGPAFGVV